MSNGIEVVFAAIDTVPVATSAKSVPSVADSAISSYEISTASSIGPDRN